ncbi:hypothetical protein OH77DRAFT_1519010 [Trametes cingulata]|nr:hypothetical protein OH77DRAFT_1519010 [Trametes cingulata]
MSCFSRLSVSTTGEVIDLDAFDGEMPVSGSTNKRKAMSSNAEEKHEFEFVQGPQKEDTQFLCNHKKASVAIACAMDYSRDPMAGYANICLPDLRRAKVTCRLPWGLAGARSG